MELTYNGFKIGKYYKLKERHKVVPDSLLQPRKLLASLNYFIFEGVPEFKWTFAALGSYSCSLIEYEVIEYFQEELEL